MKRQIVTAITAATAAIATSQADTLLNSGSFGGHSYGIYGSSHIDWTSAQAAATGLGGYLATITSDGERDLVESLRLGVEGPLSRLANFPQVWLGGFQNAPDLGNPLANWTWVTGEPWGYANWAAGEPNNAGDETQLTTGRFSNSKWNDEGHLENIAGYVVERNGVPEGGSLALVSLLTVGGLLAAKRRQ